MTDTTRTGWKIVHPDGTTGRDAPRETFQWPLPTDGTPVLVEAPGPILDHRNSCPRAPGDGLCAVRPGNVRHVTSGGVRLASCVGLLLEWESGWELGESEDGKVRLSKVQVTGVFDPLWLIRLGLANADLWGAGLANADLRDADLRGAIQDDRTVWPAGFDPIKAGVTAP